MINVESVLCVALFKKGDARFWRRGFLKVGLNALVRSMTGAARSTLLNASIAFAAETVLRHSPAKALATVSERCMADIRVPGYNPPKTAGEATRYIVSSFDQPVDHIFPVLSAQLGEICLSQWI